MIPKRKIFLLFIITFPLILTPDNLYGKKIKQSHKLEITGKENGNNNKSKGKKGETDAKLKKGTKISVDSLGPGAIKFSGYDKPVKSSKETFHIINNTDSTIRKVGIRITYLDLQNRMLHSRDTSTECIVPAKETRLASIPSWDKQHTFYYYLGPEPRMVATPYKVKIELLWVEY